MATAVRHCPVAALAAVAASHGAGETFPMLVDTGAPVRSRGDGRRKLSTYRASFELLDAGGSDAAASARPLPRLDLPGFRSARPATPALRARGRSGRRPAARVLGRVPVWRSCLDADRTLPVDDVLEPPGADAASCRRRWLRGLSFHAVRRRRDDRRGHPDFLGPRGPLRSRPTRVVLRACGSPTPSPRQGLAPTVAGVLHPARRRRQATGVDLSLLIDTGIGPLVLSRSAWARVVPPPPGLPTAHAPPAPAVPRTPPPPPLYVATWPTPIPSSLGDHPAFRLVDLEAGATTSGRLRRAGAGPPTEMCLLPEVSGLPGDLRPAVRHRSARARARRRTAPPTWRSAARSRWRSSPTTSLFLQGLRSDIRPEGPELDGLVGAGALGRSRVELDYVSSPSRAVFSCETDAPATPAGRRPAARGCRTRAQHYCFGLPRTRCRPPATRTPVFPRPMPPPTRGRRTAGRPSPNASAQPIVACRLR